VFPFPIVAVPGIGTLGLPGCINREQRLHFGCDTVLKFTNNGSYFPKFEMPIVE
jgi:hypothetical protein